MWHKPERSSPTAEYWNDTYVDEGKWTSLRGGDLERFNLAMLLIGDPAGKRVLDLGGGPLLCRAMEKAEAYVLVEKSAEALKIAKKIAPWTQTVEAALFPNPSIFGIHVNICYDITVAMGLLHYLPPFALDALFYFAPSQALIINEPIAEGYLEQYETRQTIYSLKDFAQLSERHNWRLVKTFTSTEHHFARYERRPK